VEQESVFYEVSSGYFRTLRTKLLAGRDFDSRDSRASEPIPTVVNPALARKFFGDENVLGREFSSPETKIKRHRIIGIAADSRYSDLRKGPEPMVYIPLDGKCYFSLYIRSRLDIGSVVHMVERETQGLGSGARVREITTLETLVGNTLLKEKLLAGIGGVFAVLDCYWRRSDCRPIELLRCTAHQGDWNPFGFRRAKTGSDLSGDQRSDRAGWRRIAGWPPGNGCPDVAA